MKKLPLIAVAIALALVPDIAAAQLKVGVSWSDLQEERWASADEPAIKAALDAAGVDYIATNAQSSAEKQLSDIEGLIAQNIDVLMVVAQDDKAIRQAVQKALDEEIPVIAYDRLIDMEGVFYITFDNREVGRMQARALFERVPEGNYVFVRGDAKDMNTGFVFAGQLDVLRGPIDAGRIRVVGETYVDNWNPGIARKKMDGLLTVNGDDIDAVLASNDGIAGGVVAALTADGLAGPVAVSGQDGDAAALNRIALGTQTVSVWKDARLLGAAAGAAAVELAADVAPDAVTGVVAFDGAPSGIEMNAILLTPVPITRDNLDLVVDAGWISRDVLCRGVSPGTVLVCG